MLAVSKVASTLVSCECFVLLPLISNVYLVPGDVSYEDVEFMLDVCNQSNCLVQRRLS